MNTKIVKLLTIGVVILSLAIVQNALAATPNTASSTPKAVNRAEKIEKVTERVRTVADKELDNRIASLNKLVARIQEMKKISEAAKLSITASVNSLISDLTSLKAEIETTTSTTTLKNDRELITKHYRVYALIMPKINIMTAADRINAMVDTLTVLSGKIQIRLNAMASSSPSNLATLQKSLTDINAKIADARVQAIAAVSDVIVLVPDEGDKTILASNTATLKSARGKIKLAQSDIVSAHKSAVEIVKALGKSEKESPKISVKKVSEKNDNASSTNR